MKISLCFDSCFLRVWRNDNEWLKMCERVSFWGVRNAVYDVEKFVKIRQGKHVCEFLNRIEENCYRFYIVEMSIFFFSSGKNFGLYVISRNLYNIFWSIFFDHFSRTSHITNLYQVTCSILRKKIDRFVLNNNQRSIINEPRKYLSRDL